MILCSAIEIVAGKFEFTPINIQQVLRMTLSRFHHLPTLSGRVAHYEQHEFRSAVFLLCWS